MVRSMAKPRKNPLEIGAVIRTNPSVGFWGCAIVLSAFDETYEPFELHPTCHIGVTDFISRTIFEADTLDFSSLEILTFTPKIRVGPCEYAEMRPRKCIGIYTVTTATRLDVISKIEPTMIYGRPLTLEIGDGTDGTYPLCGPLPDYLGQEAVVAWRRVHDRDRLAAEEHATLERFEAFEQKRLEESRRKRER